MLLAVRIRAMPKWKVATPLAMFAMLGIGTIGTVNSVSAVSPIAGQGPMAEDGTLPSAMKPGLYAPPLGGNTIEQAVIDPNSAFAKISAAPIADAGPAARSFVFNGTRADRARAAECLAMAVYYEAASEGIEGQRAVAQVVLNRVSHPAYPASVCQVVFQGSERATGCQFTFTCDGSLMRRPNRQIYARALEIANDALSGEVDRKVGLATHYHTHAVSPIWAPRLHPLGAIGNHRFYRWNGRAGTPGAFNVRHAGFERAAASFDARRSPGTLDETLLTMPIDEIEGTAAAIEQSLGDSAPITVDPPIEPTPAPSKWTEDKRRGELKVGSATPRLKADGAGTLKVAGEGSRLKAGDGGSLREGSE
ncbi:cell wall hydrolase [Altererythrobacter aurantiacus]|uniref:Cell wall hydrolase n=2 Tax=Parapontixanthobacter aurantiacus TaxID=1463599 RepID=A0A844ZEK0_9SPHN|nr:cell wall hydrolase [Parapontixanthobacter aurantiacus]